MILTPPTKSWISGKQVLLILTLLTILLARSGQSDRLEEDANKESEDRGAHIFNKKARRLLLRLFRRRIKIPAKSSLSLATQVSRPNIFPGIFNQEDGFITDAVIEFPMWLDLDTFSEAVFSPNSTGIFSEAKSASFIGTERCFLYEKLEWLLGLVAQFSGSVAHNCVLKFICETQAIHTFYPDYPISIAFELIHLLLTPSSGTEDPCFEEYVIAENKGKLIGRCDDYDSGGCPFSIGGVLVHNFFPTPYPQQPHPPVGNYISTPQPPPTFPNHQPDIERFAQFYAMFKHLL